MRITEVEPILLRGTNAYASGASGAEATDNGDWQLLVRIATDEEFEGWADVETLAPAAAAVISGQGMGMLGFRTMADLLIGENPLDIQMIWDKLYIGTNYYGRRGLAMQCISAIDNCLWSIRGQATGLSLARLMGGRRRDRVTAYASTLFRSTPEGMAEAAQHYVDMGFKAVKFGWGVFGEDSGRDRELVAAARDVLGMDRHLLVDPGWYPAGWTKPGPMRNRRDAIDLCAWLADYNVGWVEDFIHPERFDEYAAVRAASPVPIAAGEQLATIWEFERFIASGCVDVIQPDLSRCGGMSVAWRIAELAEKANIDCVPHSWLTHLLTGYSLQLIATLPRALFVEFNVSQSALTRGIAPPSFALDADGMIAIPDAPGIGVEVDKDFIAAHRVARQESEETFMTRQIVKPENLDLESRGRRDYFVALEHDTMWGDHLIPLTVIVGPEARSGQGLVTFGSNHGNEYEGPVVIRHLLREIPTENVRGRIILVPVLNPAAFRAGTRDSSLDDGANLNRAFVEGAGRTPALGRITHRIADFVRQHIWPHVHVVIDLHAGGDVARYWPGPSFHPIPDPEQGMLIEQTARWFGSPVVIVYQNKTPGLLPSEAERLGKITLGAELGWGAAVQAEGVRYGRQGVLAAAIHTGQLSGEISPIAHHRDGTQIKAEMVDRACFTPSLVSGHYESLLDCGSKVSQGDIVGLVHDFERIDADPWPARAGVDGVVICQAWAARVRQGQHIVVVGKIVPWLAQ